MTEAAVKAAVRERDGYRCTQCGMEDLEHVAVYGKSLEVHRLDPGSDYTVDGCTTLCRRCHGPKPRAKRRQGKNQSLRVSNEVARNARVAAAICGMKLYDYVNERLGKIAAEDCM